MNRNNERGAIVVEATISLTTFMFAIITILSIVDICYIQAKMSNSLCSSAKEISQYSYLYYKFNLDKKQSEAADEAAKQKEKINNTIAGIDSMLDSISDSQENLEKGNLEEGLKSLEDGTKTAEEIVGLYKDDLKEPKAFAVGMMKLLLVEGIEEAKNDILGKFIAKSVMERNLVSKTGGSADAFLKKHGIEDGMDGLDFQGTSLMAYGKTDEIMVVVTYDVKVISILNVDYKLKFRQCAKTKAWGRGQSLQK